MRCLPEYLEEFTDNLEDIDLPAPTHFSQDSGSERPTKVVSKSRKHSIYTHFPKDRNCWVCLRTRAPCRSRIGKALLRAGKFGDLITADHQVLNEEGEIFPLNGFNLVRSKQRLYRRRYRVHGNSPSRRKNQMLFIYTDNSLELGKSCEDLSWNHRTSTLHRSDASGIAGRAVRRLRKRNFSSIATGFDGTWLADSWEWYCYLRNVQDFLAEGKTPYERRCGESLQGPKIPCGAMI